MNNILERGSFRIEVSPQNLSINGLKFSPGEADKITGLISLAGRMADLEALPPSIGNPPFRITFDEEGKHFLYRVDHPGKVIFEFEDADTLVQTIQDGIQMFRTLLEFGPKASRSAPAVNFPDIIDGRG